MSNQLIRQAISLVVVLMMLAAVALVRNHRLLGHDFREDSNRTEGTANCDGKTGVVVINTRESGKDIQGFAGPTPVSIELSQGRIARITALANDETPSFFDRVVKSGLLDTWNGMTPQEALKVAPDAVTGATYSSKALIGNVQAGLSEAAEMEMPVAGTGFKFTWPMIVGLVVALCGAFMPLFIKSKVYRTCQLVADLVVLGVWCGSFVSYSSMVNLMANGVDLAMIVVLVLLAVALVWPLFGRKSHYCAWLCPLGAAQELAGKCTRRKFHLKQRAMKVVKWVRAGLWCLLMLALWGGAWLEWMDYEMFTAFLWDQASPWVLGVAGLFLALSFIYPRPFCQGVCPVGTLLRMPIPGNGAQKKPE